MESMILGYAGKIGMELCDLYHSFGYTQYKMSKFEEYDLYARNKDFLVSDHVLTFTDLSGKLMALKPDVTLSIVRSTRDDDAGSQKICYMENVYRASKGSSSYKEILQAGLECIGVIDDYLIAETLILAAESLQKITPEYSLVISDLDIISDLVSRLNVPAEAQEKILACISEKNMHELDAVCAAYGADTAGTALIRKVMELKGCPAEILRQLEKLNCAGEAVMQLKNVVAALGSVGFGNRIRIDFSIISDMNYYNGVVFKGYVDGVPSSVLSGGRYDRLMDKMGRRAKAIGFAVYLDSLERLFIEKREYDVDMVLLYDASSDTSALCKAVRDLTAEGVSVSVQNSRPEKLSCRQLAKLQGSEVVLLENNA